MQRYKQSSELQKLRTKNVVFLVGSLGFGLVAYWLGSLVFGLLCLFCVWRLVSPSVYFAPAKRHSVVSLDISGSTKSVRFCRTNLGTYIPCIFTPVMHKEVEKRTTNKTAQRLAGGGVKLGWQLEDCNTYTNTGHYQSTVIEDLEFTLPAAIVAYLCLLVRSDKDTIFDTVTLRHYLSWLQRKTYFAALLVSVVLWWCNGLQVLFWLISSSPTLPKGVQTAKTPIKSTMVYENTENVKEVAHA